MSRIALVRVLSACLVATGVAGCRAVPAIDFNAPRLQVTDGLRVACEDVGWGDATIENALLTLEGDRLSGRPYLDARLNDACQSDACWRCSNAIVDQVYGVD